MNIRQTLFFVSLIALLTLLPSSRDIHADLGLETEDFGSKQVEGNQVDGSPVHGKPVNGKAILFDDESTDPNDNDDDEGFSAGDWSIEDFLCQIYAGNTVLEGTPGKQCPVDRPAYPFNLEQCYTVQSSVNLSSRRYQDDIVDMSVKVPGGHLKIYRIYANDKWQFEHEFNKLKISDEDPDVIHKSGLRYTKDESGNYRYRNLTIKKSGDIYRWQNKQGDYTVYTATGQLVESGNRIGILARFVYEGEQLLSINDRSGTQIFDFSYNIRGKIAKAYDNYGREVSYRWDEDKLISIRNVLGHSTRYSYNEQDQLISKADSTGRKFFITYHSDGAVQSVLSRSGGGHHFSFRSTQDSDSRYARVQSTEGQVEEYWFNERGDTLKISENGKVRREEAHQENRRTIINEIGDRTTRIYDASDNLIEEHFSDGFIRTYEYDSKNRLVSVINELGVENRYIHNTQGQLISIREAYGLPEERKTQFEYDETGRLVRKAIFKDGEPIFTKYDYDNNDNIIRIIDELGYDRVFQHDYMGNPVKISDPMGLTTVIEYNRTGRMTGIQSPDGFRGNIVYDQAGRIIQESGGDDTGTTYSYDHQDNLTSITDPLGNKITHKYDSDNRLRKTLDAEGNYTIFFYENGSERINKVIDSAGNEISITYNSLTDCGSCEKTFGSIPVEISFPTFTRQFSYDSRGRIKTLSNISNGKTYTQTFEYDGLGRKTKETDANGKHTSYTYDALGHLLTVTEPGNITSLFTYDSLGNLKSFTDGKGQKTLFEYDQLGRKTKEIRSLGNIISFSYDPSGRLVDRTDSKGQQIHYLYDTQSGQLLAYIFRSDDNAFISRSVSFEYDSFGQMIGYDDGVTKGIFEYDALGRKTQETIDYGKFSASHSYSYFRNGKKRSYIGPDNIRQIYSYNKLGNLRKISIEGVGDLSVEAYNWLQPEALNLPGGVRKNHSYDGLMRLISTESLSGDKLIQRLKLSYDDSGSVIRKRTGDILHDYQYDQANRLVEVLVNGNPQERYHYDQVNNRLSSHLQSNYHYDSNNQLIQVGKTRYEYDNNGNTVGKNKGEKRTSYKYNLENRLSEVTSGGKLTLYHYDPAGRRIFKEVDGLRTWFHYSDEGLVAEFNDEGEITRSYSWYPNGEWNTKPLMLTIDDKHYFYHNDHLDTPLKLTDLKGNVVWESEYDSYGQATIKTEEVENNFRLPGQYYDAETALYYNWHRYYNPETGRYMTPDPIGLNGGVNLYAYAYSDPLNYVDPTGQSPLSIIIKEALKRGIKKGFKEYVENRIKKEILGNLTEGAYKKAAKELLKEIDDAMALLNSEWWELIIEFIPWCGDAYGFAKMAKNVKEVEKRLDKIEKKALELRKKADKDKGNGKDKPSINGPSRTKPSGQKGGKPQGEPAPETGSQKKKHKRENEAADTLAEAGYDVDQGPHKKPNGKEPDYKIEGEYFDCLAPDSDNIDQVRKGISRKVSSGQADRIVLNLDDTNLSPSDVSEMLKRKPKEGLKEVIGIKNGKIVQIFP